MDPVLQRLGDVTIQRLEKPKEPPKAAAPEPPTLQEMEEDDPIEEPKEEEAQSIKRISVEEPGPSYNKKIRMDRGELTLSKLDEMSSFR